MHCVFSLINLNFESLDMFHIFMQGSSVFSFMCISEDELLFFEYAAGLETMARYARKGHCPKIFTL